MPSIDAIIELDAHSHDKPEGKALPSMKLSDALYIAINALNPIGERYSQAEQGQAKSELTKLYDFLYGSQVFSVAV
jgi:hypothetical protein